MRGRPSANASWRATLFFASVAEGGEVEPFSWMPKPCFEEEEEKDDNSYDTHNAKPDKDGKLVEDSMPVAGTAPESVFAGGLAEGDFFERKVLMTDVASEVVAVRQMDQEQVTMVQQIHMSVLATFAEQFDIASDGDLGENEDDAAAEQHEIEDDPGLDDLLGALADAATGILDKEALKMRMMIFTNTRVAEGDDCLCASAEVKSLIKACKELKVVGNLWL
jgi:hypothetical protein